MFEYDFTVERIRASAQSAVVFLILVSDIETVLLTIRALERCGIADDLDVDGWPSRTTEIIWIAEQLGQAYELKLIPDRLFHRYVTDLIRLGQDVYEYAWNYGFQSGVNIAQDVD